MLNWLRRFMIGRYGVDQFNKFLLGLSVVLLLLTSFFGRGFLYFASVIVLIYSYFRIFSRNFSQRIKENNTYLYYKDKLVRFFRKGKNNTSQRLNHHIYKCPQCKQKIRVPRGKGKIMITCPKCRREFMKRS